ncbi:unnamed protein product [Owenia fusiformis]|uniref:Uncharacterized protein n=1 Tax=Owenia fusiformis TaxID=6347 RepID=A0A8S4PDS8_OWEFU|nr:unnamed protein product [Owenia fusiformis]
MSVYMPPIDRKKPVDNKYEPDTFRVISMDAELDNRPEVVSHYMKCFEKSPYIGGPVAETRPREDHRLNNPHPTSCGFLRSNVKLLMDPVCDVHTITTQHEQDSWWPHRESQSKLKVPDHTLDTTARKDFQYRGDGKPQASKHCNPEKNAALGGVPVNFMRERDGKQRFIKEGISYEHQYNSRLDPQYPIRGKRHGSFVWSQMSEDKVKDLLHHYGNEYLNNKTNNGNKKSTKTSASSASRSVTLPSTAQSGGQGLPDVSS